jgi:hypothetical protein
MFRRTWVATLTGLVAASAILASGSAGAGAAAPRAATSTAFCAKLGATGPVVRDIFGAHATPSDVRTPPPEPGFPATTYCQITPAGAATTGSTQGCSGVECTDIFSNKSPFAASVANLVLELKEYGHGHVTKHAVKGAGSGAVLVSDTHYGDPSEGLGPVLYLRAGSRTIGIQGSLGGPPVPSKWERLARAIHRHLS